VFAGAVIYKIITDSSFPKERMFNFIRIAVLLQIGVSLSASMGFNPWHLLLSLFTRVAWSTQDIGPFIGTVGNRDILGAFIAFSVPLFIDWKYLTIGRHKVNVYLTIVLTMLFFCPSPGAIAGIAGLAVYYHKNWKTAFTFALIAVLYAGTYILTSVHMGDMAAAGTQLSELVNNGSVSMDTAQQGRLWKWMVAAGNITDSWTSFIFGYSLGATWGKKYPLHNEYLQCWYELGLIGFSIMAGYVITTLKHLIKSKDRVLMAMFAAICVDMMANYPFHISTTAFMAIIICAVIEKERLKNG
jgi:hypothetical protein